jgi:hypothetical protein
VPCERDFFIFFVRHFIILIIFHRDSGGPLVIDGQLAGVLVWRTFPCGDGLPGKKLCFIVLISHNHHDFYRCFRAHISREWLDQFGAFVAAIKSLKILTFLILSLNQNKVLVFQLKCVSASLKMKLALIISLIFASAIFPSNQEGISQHVINGEDAAIEDHPHMAHIYTTFLATCGASILSPRTVLTVSLA